MKVDLTDKQVIALKEICQWLGDRNNPLGLRTIKMTSHELWSLSEKFEKLENKV